MHLAHIVNPVNAEPESDVRVAQPITFETMRIARDFAAGSPEVSLHAVQHAGEARVSLPPGFQEAPDLTRSAADLKPYRRRRTLALIGDILDRLHAAAPRADWLVYTNADIAVQPHFYRAVALIAAQGFDAFVINRRTIPAAHAAIEDIPLMYAEVGLPHPGYDCFVFRRELHARLRLGTVHVGSAGVGRALLANLVLQARAFRELRDGHLTFHIGDAAVWRRPEYAEYQTENWNEYLECYGRITRDRGEPAPEVRSYLLDTGAARFIPDFRRFSLREGRLELRVDGGATRGGEVR